jgi:hypothetical protein
MIVGLWMRLNVAGIFLMCDGVVLKLIEPSVRKGLARDFTSGKKRQQIKPESYPSATLCRGDRQQGQASLSKLRATEYTAVASFAHEI